MTECDMLIPVKEFFQKDGWNVYEEIPVRVSSSTIASIWTPDMILTKGDEIAVVEGKLTLNDTVVQQADRWRPYADWVWIATGLSLTIAATSKAKHHGLGLIGSTGEEVSVGIDPRKNENADHRPIIDALPDTYTTSVPAGSPGGLRMTPDQRQWDPVKRALADSDCPFHTSRGVWDSMTREEQDNWLSWKDFRLQFQKASKKGIIGIDVHETAVLTYSLRETT